MKNEKLVIGYVQFDLEILKLFLKPNVADAFVSQNSFPLPSCDFSSSRHGHILCMLKDYLKLLLNLTQSAHVATWEYGTEWGMEVNTSGCYSETKNSKSGPINASCLMEE